MPALTLADGLPPLTVAGLKAAVTDAEPGCMCDPELFTGPAGIEADEEPVLDRAARLDAARAVCAGCPARLACLGYALRTRPTAGVWAGWTHEEIAFIGTAARSREAKTRKSTRLRTAPAVPERGVA